LRENRKPPDVVSLLFLYLVINPEHIRNVDPNINYVHFVVEGQIKLVVVSEIQAKCGKNMP
jgi:hypothetical protein